jgi:predicted metal-dependent HD superfamily phosphohydrolase
MNQINYPDATRRLVNALRYAGVSEIMFTKGITLSDILKASEMTYEDLMSNRNFSQMRKNLKYPAINEDDTIQELILKIHNAINK